MVILLAIFYLYYSNTKTQSVKYLLDVIIEPIRTIIYQNNLQKPAMQFHFCRLRIL